MRINVIDPMYLADQHLVAEYRELKMLPKSLVRSLNSKHGLDLNKVPKEYTLNKGHGYFFYDKIQFIIDRFELLLIEMKRRGFQTNFSKLPLSNIPEHLFGNYIPTDDAKLINLERIRLRIAGKPTWFKFMGGYMTQFDWEVLYERYYGLEKIDFKTIDEIKNDPIEDNKDLPVYAPGSGHY